MPNRILRDGILESARVNALSEEAECFYRRLMSIVDDYGRYEAQPALLRARLYPLKLDSKSEAQVAALLNQITAARLAFTYRSGGKVYLELLNFRQQTRSVSKHPEPNAQQMKSFAEMPICAALDKQTLANAHLVVVVVVGVVVFGDVVVVVDGPASAGHKTTDDFLKQKRPKSVDDVIEYGAQVGLSEAECRRFHDYNVKRKWKLPAGAEGWPGLIGQWQERVDDSRPGKGKNNSGEAPFDRNHPHAHTGGLPIVA